INNINNLYTIDTDNASINFNIKYNNLNSNLKYISIYQNGLLINKFNLLYGYNNELNFKNYFIKSGIPYTFDIVLSDNNTNYLIHTINNVVNYYEHCWLIEDLNTQIMLGYSPNVSSISLNIKENIVETFNKYPLIVRTGLTNYKSLQFSAFLTYNGNESFIKELDGDEDYYVKEKVFREKIYKILTNGKPKIFKTDTEDLILCKITNITLTPKTELSR
ncbi:MAG: hypothetical protein N2517_09455, partial [Ignavibacteria bacterium]|nr:hypothetical protein [Ignavibacteria bacterium]